MVGRMLNFNLYPFNFCESLRAKERRLENIYNEHNKYIKNFLFEGKIPKITQGKDLFYESMIKEYQDFSIWGGYPAVVLSKTAYERKKVLADIYNAYILKDIKTLLQLATEKNLFLLSQYLATQIGNIIVYQNLSQSAGLDYRKLKKHLAILEETFICKQIKPFFKNRQRELAKNPKVYFLDLGFRNLLMENFNSFEKRPDTGAIVENTVFIRLNELLRGVDKINFWRTKVGAEVDFILHIEGMVFPLEVKFSPLLSTKISKSLASFIDHFNPERALVLTRDYWGSLQRGSTKVLFAPVYYL